MDQKFDMVAKTLQGLEEVLAQELRELGAEQVEPGLRMVSFKGNLEILYKANFCCRTALRILRPFYKFIASGPDELYERAREYDWSKILGPDKTFAVDTVSHSEEFSHSRYATYRVKDAINDWWGERMGNKRPRVSTTNPDILINLHISGNRVTLSLDSSGESLHKRGYRIAQTEAPINEVLAAGIILLSGWCGEVPFVDPMCGSGTFLIEAAMIAGNIYPGIFRSHYAFEKWKDFDPEIFENIYNDDTRERKITVPIIGTDISPKAIGMADKNIRNARLNNYIDLSVRAIADWTVAPPAGVLITNPPYGERLNPAHLDEIYVTLGSRLKHVFTGYHAWILGYREEFFVKIGLAPSKKIELNNGGLDCKLQEYIIFDGTKRDFRSAGGRLKSEREQNRDSRPQRNAMNRPFKPTFRRNSADTVPGERFRKAFEENEARQNSRRKMPRGNYPFRKDNKNNKDSKENTAPVRRGPFVGKEPSLPPQQGPMMRQRHSEFDKRPPWMLNKDKDKDNS